jgi:hypothetical protein
LLELDRLALVTQLDMASRRHLALEEVAGEGDVRLGAGGAGEGVEGHRLDQGPRTAATTNGFPARRQHAIHAGSRGFQSRSVGLDEQLNPPSLRRGS